MSRPVTGPLQGRETGNTDAWSGQPVDRTARPVSLASMIEETPEKGGGQF